MHVLHMHVDPRPIHSFLPDISVAPLQVHYYSLLRGAPDYSIDTVAELTRRSATGNCELRTCQGSYVAARMGFEPATLRTQGTEVSTEPPRPTSTLSSSSSMQGSP